MQLGDAKIDSMSTKLIPPGRRLFESLQKRIPLKTLCGPGPSNCPPQVAAAASLPLLGHLHPEYTEVMDDVKTGMQYAFQTSNAVTLAISGTGHAGMEAACMNMTEPGDKVLVGVNGIWGERFSSLCERLSVQAIPLSKSPGVAFTFSEIEEALKKHKPKALFLTQGESSTGVMQPLEGVGHLCSSYDTFSVIDTVASLGATPFLMDQWGIDVAYSASQKVLGSPPGAAPISFSDKAFNYVKSRQKKVPSFYFDIVELANYWGCDGAPARRYHHTGMISTIYCLRESLSMLAAEGLENCWLRHASSAKQLHAGLHKLGIKLLVEDQAHRLPSLTTAVLSSHDQVNYVIKYLMTKHNVEIARGLGPTASPSFSPLIRIGLMGYNSNSNVVDRLLRLIQEALNSSDAPK